MNIKENINRLAKVAKLNHIFGKTPTPYIIVVEGVNKNVANIANIANTISESRGNCCQMPSSIESWGHSFYLIYRVLTIPMAKVAKVAKTLHTSLKRREIDKISLAKTDTIKN